ncbi:MAG TPA: branched-chain amino acid ABC transporter permease [Actinomycetota bacterium]
MSAGLTARRVARLGMLGGMGVIYLALVGMVQTFDGVRLVGDQVTLGRVLLILPPLSAAYVLARPRIVAGEAVKPDGRAALVGGAIIGVTGGALVGLSIVVANGLPERFAAQKIFTSVTPALISVVTFDRAIAPGIGMLVVLATVAGAAGAGLAVLGWKIRRPLITGLLVVLLLSMLQNVFRVMIGQLGLDTAWLYSVRLGGLTYIGAILTFAVPAGISAFWANEGITLRQRLSGATREGQRQVRLLAVAAVGLLLAVLPFLLGSFLSAVLGRVGLFLLMGLGLNIVVGYAGLLDLGYVAFFAVGAYAMGVLTAAANSGSSIHVGMGFFEAVPIVVLLAAVTGLLIGAPVLRLRGDYLAIVTLGFGEIARVLVTSDALKSFLGGAQGLIAIPAPSFTIGGLNVDFRDPQPFYYLVLVFCVLAGFVSYRLANSRIGRAWVAMREDEQVSEVMGVSTVRYKLLAFATGAAVGSVSGALFAVQIGSLAPTSFNILISIQALAIIILGGMGSIPGVVVGALVLVGIPGFLTEFETYQLLIYGAVLIGIMLYRPEGLIPNVRRTRELKEEDRLQDAWSKGAPDAEPATISWEEAPG